jgi:hypothetical protein
MPNTSRNACISPTQCAVQRLSIRRGIAPRVALWLIKRFAYFDGREIGLEAADFAIAEHYRVSDRTARRWRDGEALPVWRIWQIYADAVKGGVADDFLRAVFAEAWAAADARLQELQVEHEDIRRRLAEMERRAGSAARGAGALDGPDAAGDQLRLFQAGKDLHRRQRPALIGVAVRAFLMLAPLWRRAAA